MTDKYALLKKRPRVCLRVYGLHFEELEALLRKVQITHLKKLEENPISPLVVDTILNSKYFPTPLVIG